MLRAVDWALTPGGARSDSGPQGPVLDGPARLLRARAWGFSRVVRPSRSRSPSLAAVFCLSQRCCLFQRTLPSHGVGQLRLCHFCLQQCLGLHLPSGLTLSSFWQFQVSIEIFSNTIFQRIPFFIWSAFFPVLVFTVIAALNLC